MLLYSIHYLVNVEYSELVPTWGWMPFVFAFAFVNIGNIFVVLEMRLFGFSPICVISSNRVLMRRKAAEAKINVVSPSVT